MWVSLSQVEVECCSAKSKNPNSYFISFDFFGVSWTTPDIIIHFKVVLVTGGARYTDGTRYKHPALTSVELLNLDGSFNCMLPSLPEGRSSHTQTGLVACGGYPNPRENLKTCDTFSIGMEEWKKSHVLREERHSHTSWASPQGVMLLGGWDSIRTTGKEDETTEVLTNDGETTPSFGLKYKT